MEKTKFGYKFSKIPRKPIEEPIPMDLSREITKLFEIKKIKKRRISEYMCESIRKTKLRALKGMEQEPFLAIPSRHTTAEDFRKYGENLSTLEMPRYEEKYIKQKIAARGLENKYPLLVGEMLKETKVEYVKTMHYSAMNLRIKSCYPDFVFTVDPYKFIGKTERYNHFLQIRNRLQRKWILHYPVLRKIHKQCVINLPYELFQINFTKINTLPELKYIFKDKLRTASQYIYEFCLQIISIVDAEETKHKEKLVSRKYLAACTGLLSLHISRSIAHTLLNVVRLTSADDTKAYLQLDVFFDKQLQLYPEANEVIAAYHEFIDSIIDIGKEVYRLERKKVRGYENKCISLCLTDEFVMQCKDDIEKNINKHYQPVLLCMQDLDSKFSVIYSDIDSQTFHDSIADIKFEAGCTRINYYRNYLHKVMFIPDHEFARIGKIFLDSYRETLHEGLNKNITSIFQTLCNQHYWEVSDICRAFRTIQERATENSKTTEELIETGKFMAWVKNENLPELNTRVYNSLSSLCEIIDLGILTKEHMELNAAAIQWLDEILPILEQHSINFETMKFEAEEKLQKVVEDVNDMIEAVYPLLVVLDDMDDISRTRSYMNTITLHMIKIKEVEVQIKWINKEEANLSFPKSTYSEYENLKNYVHPFYHLMKLCLDVQRDVSVWQDGPFEMLHYEPTKASVEEYHKELTELYKVYRKKLRQAQDENIPLRFKGTVDDPDILNWPAPLKLCGTALRLIEAFKPAVDVMKIICNPNLRKRHWVAMSEIAGEDVSPNAGTTLRKLMKVDFQKALKEYEIISTGATKEKLLLDDLQELEEQWESIRFTVVREKESGDITMLSNLEDIDEIVNDHCIKLVRMRSSVFVKPHEDKVMKFLAKILKIKTFRASWILVQSEILKLLPIFCNDDLKIVAPNESALFTKTVNMYRSFTAKIIDDSRVMHIIETTDIASIIETCSTDLEIIDKGIVSYLDHTRQAFPRFYFLSNDELLRFISDPKRALSSGKFLIKLFPGIQCLNTNDTHILGISNSLSETLLFANIINKAEDHKVETLCSRLEEQMRASLKSQMGDCFRTFKRIELRKKLSLYCEQIIRVVTQIYWTESMESALSLTHNIKLRIYHEQLMNNIINNVELLSTNLTNNEKRKIQGLIVDLINNKTLVQHILDSKNDNSRSFEWEAHFKYHFKNESCHIKVMDTALQYSYEYFGHSFHHIATPITDRCLRTLINAFSMHYNGLIRGLSGAGKTQTIKWLVQSFGGLLIRFHCSRNINCLVLNRLLIGSLSCGSWLFLENIDLVPQGVLSVLSQELYSIQMAKKQNSNHCSIRGISTNYSCGSFICASIGSVNYKQELHHNLKVTFRTVNMLLPELEMIAESILLCQGFRTASPLSKKTCHLMSSLRDILPERSHYSFGLNSLKQVLNECKDLRGVHSDEGEEVVLANCLNKVIFPLIETEHRNVYNSIFTEIFPKAYLDQKYECNLESIIDKLFTDFNLQYDESLKTNVLQIHQNICRRSSIVLVGGTSSGKTTSLRLCKRVVELLTDQKLIHHFINVNCYNNVKLTEEHEKSGYESTDRVIPKLISSIETLGYPGKTWIILDGTISSIVIENIIPMLDEDKTSNSKNGEDTSTRILFEVADLNTCSPSIITHCAVIYFHQSPLIWKHLIKSWIDTTTSRWIEDFKVQIFDIFCWIVPPSIEFIKLHCCQLCSPSDTILVNNMVHLTQYILDEVFSSSNKKEEDGRNIPAWIQATIIQAAVIGLGGLLDGMSRTKFDEFFKLLWRGGNVRHPHPKTLEKLEVAIPQDGTLFDYQYLYKQRGNWKLYQDILKMEKILESPYMIECLIPTVDTLRLAMILNIHIKNRLPFLLVGPCGTGKTILVKHTLINTLDRDQYDVAHMNFNANMDLRTTQNFVLSNLNKKKNNVYTPPPGKNFLLFIDNLNQVTTNEFGDSKCTELLRQFLDHRVWYDFDSGNVICPENTNIVSSMGLVEGCNKKLSGRFLRHFGVFGINEFTQDTVTRIYTNSMLHTWRRSGFPGDTAACANQIVQATYNIYKQIIKFCRPTVSRCHYSFSLNSISKVIQGCAMLRKETYDANKKIFVKLWTHEILRVFGDRLSILDTNWLLQKIKEAIAVDFNESFEDYFETNGSPSEIIFSTINDRNNNCSSPKYEENVDRKHLFDMFTEAISHYNENHEFKIEMVVFQNAIEKLMKLCRILSFSPGNALLLGPCASGRQTLTKLVCFMYKYELFQPVITEKYSHLDWNGDMKTVLKEAGALEKKCVLLVTEEEIIHDSFLQMIENLLVDGDIPGLYTLDEKQEILELTRLSAQGGNKNLEISSSSVFLHFNRKWKENLHLILSLSSINEKLRSRLRKYPGLFNCQVIWWDEWPDQSLKCVAEVWVSSLEMDTEVNEQVNDALMYFHRDSRSNAKQLQSTNNFPVLVTFTAFLHLVKIFTEQVDRKRNEINAKKKLYLQGLGKLSYAADQISNMQRSLAEYQPQLAEMTEKAVQMTEQIALETIEVEKASALVRKDEGIASEQASVAQVLKSECEAELAQAIPILEDAISALNTLKPSDITLVKSMKNPPDAIKLVMAAVCVIKDVRPDRIPDPSTGRKTIDYWGPSKRILGDMNFLQTLKDFDKDNIKPEIMVKIRKEYLPHKDFKPHVVAKASSAAEGLCKWIIAMDLYDKVAKEVAPKKEKLENSEKEYAATMAILNQKKDEVKRIEKKLAGLNALLDEATKKQLELQLEVDICNKKLGSAQKLIGSLGGEKLRWTEAVENLRREEKLLCGNVLISSAMVAYLGPYNGDLRYTIIQKWHQYVIEQIPCCEQFDVIKSLSSEYKIEQWLKKGLPNDGFFLQNAAIHDCSRLFCVLVDPEYQADDWIKRTERRNNLTISKFTHNDYLTKLRHCIEVGKPLLIHKIKNVIPPCLNKFLSKCIQSDGDQTMSNLNGDQIRINPQFRFYMVSNMAAPKFPAEIQSKLTLINFTITNTALGYHILRIVTEIEKPELKKMRKDLYSKKGKNRVELAELETKILTTLCESEADILEDETSIKILDQSKDLALVVREKQKESRIIEETIDTFSSQYNSIPNYIANLYMCIAKLSKINYVYQFSFAWFLHLFHKSILLSAKSRELEQRCQNIKNLFTYSLYKDISSCLFEKDKLTFLFLYTINISQFKNKVNSETLDLLMTVDSTEGLGIEEKVNQLGDLGEFRDLMANFDYNSWKNCEDSSDFESIASPWYTNLTNFQKLLVTKILKPHHFLDQIKYFMSTELGDQFLKTGHYDISDTYNESYSLSPILFILSKEIDPLDKIQSLAKKRKVFHSLKIISLGPENISKAVDLLDLAQSEGSWLCLQNCHVVPTWFEFLERKLVEMNFDNTHENFRLWLTSEATEDIPIELLQSSIKVVLDYPSGFKENLLRVYRNEPICEPDFLGSCPGKHQVFSRLLYGLVSFHCALQKKKSFGVRGWTSPFIFTDQELFISINQLQNIMIEDEFNSGSNKKLEYLIGRCHYDPPIQAPISSQCVIALLEQFLNLEVAERADYKFNNSVCYGLPKKSDYKDYIKYISSLPEDDNPEVFGINRFVNDFASTDKSKDILKSILHVHRNHEEKLIENNEFSLITSIEDIINDIPPMFENNSISSFILQEEISLYNSLLRKMSETLQHLKKSIGGIILITTEYEDMAEDIMKGTVPKLWSKYTFCNDNNLAVFMTNLKVRIEYFKSLKENDCHFWVAAFFRPKALIAQHKLSNSNSNFDFVVLENQATGIKEGIAFTGLYIVGAKWSTHCHTLIENNSSVFHDFPPVWLRPAGINSQKDNVYDCPLYRSSKRYDFICSIPLGTDDGSKHWTKRGVKLVCQV